MTYRYQQKNGVILLIFVTVLFLVYTVPQIPMLLGGLMLREWGLVLLVYLLLVALLWSKYYVLLAVRLDEHGVTVVRRGLRDVQFSWASLTVSERAGARRAAGGMVFERDGEEEPYFLPFNRLTEEDVEAMLQALQERLGPRYGKEEWDDRGTRDV